MNIPNLTEAHVTQEGIVTAVSRRKEEHPVFKTPARGIRLEIPVTPDEKRMMRILRERDEVQWHVRSSVAQLGVEAFDPATTMVHFDNHDSVVVDTLCTSLSGENGERVIHEMGRLSRLHEWAIFGRALMLPAAARRGHDAVQDQLKARTLRAKNVRVRPDGEISMPLLPVEYKFDDALFDDDALMQILTKQTGGRALLSKYRTEHPLPSLVPSHGFFVGRIDVHSSTDHVLLKSETFHDDTVKGDGIQTKSPCLDGGRSVNGSRQVEIRVNGNPVDVSRLWMRASLYKAAILQAAGV